MGKRRQLFRQEAVSVATVNLLHVDLTLWPDRPALPAWLIDLPPTEVQEPPALVEHHRAELITPFRNVEERLRRLRRFEDLLRSCRNYDEVRICALEEGLSLSRSLNLTRIAFTHLLNIRAPLDMLLKFLEDTLEDAGLTYGLLSRLLRSEMGQDYDKDTLCAWIHGQVSRGSLFEKEISSLLEDKTPDDTGNELQQASRSIDWQVYWAIWDGLRSCSLHTFRDLRFDTLRVFVQAVARIGPVDQGSQIIIEIASVLDGPQSRDILPVILDFMKRVSDYRGRTPNAIAPDRANRESFPRLLQLLEGLPHHMSAECVVWFSSEIILRCRYKDSITNRRFGRVRDWLSILGIDLFQRARQNSRFKKKWQLIEEHLTTLQPGIMMLYIRLFRKSEIPPFLQEYWTLQAQNQGFVPDRGKNATTLSSKGSDGLPLRGEQLASHSSDRHGIEGSYIDMIQNMLASDPSLLRTTLPTVLSELRQHNKPKDILLIVRYLQDRRFPVDTSVLANEVVEHSKFNPVLALKLFRAWPSLRIAQCPGLMDAIISDRRIRPGAPLNLFYRDSPNLQATNRFLRESQPLPLKHDQALLLHEMALAFAQAAHLSPREALRKVMRCFHHFIGRYDLLKPQISEAMIVAGIIRYLEAGIWVSSVSLKKILAIVREVEGEKVADEIDRMVFVWRGRVVASRVYKERMWKRFSGVKEREKKGIRYRKTLVS